MADRLISYRVTTRIPGLKRANPIIREELVKTMGTLGKYLQGQVREKQREDTGEERRRTLYRVKSSTNYPSLSVYNTSVQALIDETGAKWPGKMPPYGKGSKLYKWVIRKGFPGAATFAIARKIKRRGLPRPGDPLRRPFYTTKQEGQGHIRSVVNTGFIRAVNRINKEK